MSWTGDKVFNPQRAQFGDSPNPSHEPIFFSWMYGCLLKICRHRQQGHGRSSNLLQSPTLPSAKPVSQIQFSLPTPATPSESIPSHAIEPTNMMNKGDLFMSNAFKSPSSSSPPSSSALSSSMQGHGWMDNVASIGSKRTSGNGLVTSRSQAASWSGSFANMLGGETKLMDQKPLSMAAMDQKPLSIITQIIISGISTGYVPMNGGNLGNDLQVEL
ncbi:hypothetical protein AMTR_s00049p00131180 [Amborella trichopoda]|uniref:Uncharacterized protein n=1 Tax=Amborella trichopoda TaxID=13333 RepID=W1PZT6_AMBTC|nr:hypothetical protein AMTR_s00049p00131180 [Amborella trichopoda]